MTIKWITDFPEVTTLYKLRPLTDIGRVKDILFENRVRFSKADVLNDDLECKPTYKLGDWESAEYRNQFYLWAESMGRRSLDRDLTEEQARHLTSQLSLACETAFRAKYKIFSTAGALSNKLWEEYGDNHKGIAIGFDATQHPWNIASKVTYLATLPELDVTEQSPLTLLENHLLTKTEEKWSHEQEFRLYTPSGSEDNSDDHLAAKILPLQDQFYSFRATSLIEIIGGTNLSPENQSLVERWAKELNISYRQL